MKTLIFSIAICLFGTTFLPAQSIVTKPDLVGRIQQSGAKLVITVDNLAPVNPNNASGKARSSSAKLNLGGQEQTIQVPELQPDGQYKKEIPIPVSLLNKSFVGTLKVDAGGVVVESNENNNTFTGTFNECDLSFVLNTLGQLELLWNNNDNPRIYHFKIKNNGARKSVRSVTQVFAPGVKLRIPTPEIAPGGTASLSFSSSASLCDRSVSVECDIENVVIESNEGNNKASLFFTCED